MKIDFSSARLTQLLDILAERSLRFLLSSPCLFVAVTQQRGGGMNKSTKASLGYQGFESLV